MNIGNYDKDFLLFLHDMVVDLEMSNLWGRAIVNIKKEKGSIRERDRTKLEALAKENESE